MASTKPTLVYKFFFACEGRQVGSIEDKSLREAKAAFYRRNPQFKKAKGEIYFEVETAR
jgi:hypothetical protein